MLTILRRFQGQPDPVRIEWPNANPLVIEWPGDASIEVRAVNRDLSGATFGVWDCGNEQWLAKVLDATGSPMPAFSRTGVWDILSSHTELAPHEALTGHICLMNRIGPLAPGEYRMHVAFHDRQIPVAASDEILLKVTPRRVTTTRAEQAMLSGQFAALCAFAPAVFADHAFQRWLDAGRAAEKTLVDASWRAVPVLLDALTDGQASARSRARALELLRRITDLPFVRWDIAADSFDQGEIEKWRACRGTIEVELQ